MEVNRGYKQTEVGVIPEDWDVIKLGDIGECLIGLTYSPSNVKTDGTLVLRSSNVQNGSLSFNDNVYVDAEIPQRIRVINGDILVCVRNGSRALIGKSALLDKRVEGQTFGAFMSVYRTKDFGYIFQQFQSDLIKRQINENIGATINQITNRNLNSFKVPFPTDNLERKAITGALSDLDALLATQERLLIKKRDIKQAVMQQLLSGKKRLQGFVGEWEVKKLSDLGHTYGGLTGKSKTDFLDGTVPYIPFMNVMRTPVIDTSDFDYVKLTENEMQNKAAKGDLFFNGSSETPEEVGMCSVLLENIPNLHLNSFCFGFRFNSDAHVNELFFAYWFRCNEGRKVMSVLAQGATRYNIAKSAFLKLSLNLPSKEEQTAIATILSDMDAEIILLEKQRDKTSAIKQGMMQELLTGKIRLA